MSFGRTETRGEDSLPNLNEERGDQFSERVRNYADQHDWEERPYGLATNWVCRKCTRSSYDDPKRGMKRDEKPKFYSAQCISGHGLTDTD